MLTIRKNLIDFESLVRIFGEVLDIKQYDENADETVFYSTFSEISNVNDLNVLIRMNIGGEVLLEVTTSEKWTVCTFSFPVCLLEKIDLESFSTTKIAEIFSLFPFKIAFGIHDYEWNAKEVEEHYLQQIRRLRPALLYIVKAEGLSLEVGETNVEGLPR